MGLDQHRAQITAEWIETQTGEISCARLRPADRQTVREVLEQFAGQDGLEVALEATTVVVKEVQLLGADVHLAEPTEAAALKGKKRRAKTDWADARHLRALPLIGRIPESWIPPAHILDLRARVRTRHLLSHRRTEWQQRMHLVLFHKGLAHHRNLLSVASRQWLIGLQLSPAAREQLDVALHVIDSIEQRLTPFDRELRQIANRQPGCRRRVDEIFGVGGLTAVTIVAELRDVRRLPTPAMSSDTAGWTSLSTNPTCGAAPGTSRARVPPALRWTLYEAAQRARFLASPDRPHYEQLAARIGGNRACLALARKL
jgi:transposase